MLELETRALLTGTGYDLPVTVGDMIRSGNQIQLMNYQSGERLVLTLLSGGGSSSVSRQTLTAQNREALTVTGQAGSIDGGLLDALTDQAAEDSARAQSSFLSLTPAAANAVLLLSAQTATGQYLYAAQPDGAGLSVLRIEADGSLTHLSDVADGAGQYGTGISCMARITLDGTRFLFTGSALEHGIDVYRIGSGGGLTALDSVGTGQLLPVQGVSALQAVSLNGQGFLIAAASGSSSLTVMAIAADGSLSVTDHVVDGLATRFANVTQLEIVEVGGSVYLLAAGSDAGVSLLTLTPDGHLVHLDALEDGTGSALSGISALTAVAVGDGIEILASSGSEGGLSRIRVDMDDLGQGAGSGARSGGAGQDILVDGAGQDTLTGGAGADLFVLGADGVRDEIADFDPAQDRLDLSQWAFLYGTAQITFQSRSYGALLTYGEEQLVLRTADGTPLTAEAFAALSVAGLSHYEVTLGPPEATPVETGPEGVLRSGGTGNDVLTGSAGDDTLEGGGGDDLLRGLDGADLFRGGAGHDIASYEGASRGLTLDMGDPTQNSGAAEGDSFAGIEGIIGSDMADRLYGGSGGNSLDGRGGNDFIDGRAGDDTLLGGDGNDSLLGHEGDDSIDGGGNRDNIAAGEGRDTVRGGDGNDSIGGGEDNDSLYGDAGSDTIGGGLGDDLIEGGDGRDVASGGGGSDVLRGGRDGDTLAGSFGDDNVDGGDGADSLGGGAGRDALWGRGGDDSIGGGEGNDTVWGGAGDDFLAGASGRDSLDGGSGADRLNGGTGADTLTGGTGADVFVFSAEAAPARDVITDFTPGEDLVSLRGATGGFASFVLTEGDGFVDLTAEGFSIRFEGLSAEDLHAWDFLFS